MLQNTHDHELTYLDEAWGILPKQLSVVDTLEGEKLYSSEAVNKKFLHAIKKQKILKPVADKLGNLIDRQILVPCFASKNLIRLVGHKFFSDQLSKNILGFYFSDRNKIYILLDNHTKFLIFMSNKELSSVTIHELQHYASWNLKMKFFAIHKDTFRDYYRTFFKLYLGINVPDNVTDIIVYYILKNFEYPKRHSTKFLVKYADLMFDGFEKIHPDKDTLERQITNMLAAVKVYLTNPNSFISALQSGQPAVLDVVKALHKSYKGIRIRNPNSLTIQELIYPSEVIAIQSQKRPNSNHYTSIKAL